MKFYSRSVIATIAGFLLCACGFFSAAHSQSCNFSITNVAFGTVDVTANAAVDTTATLSVTCTALVSVALRVCVNLGPGTGGGANAANRLMKSRIEYPDLWFVQRRRAEHPLGLRLLGWWRGRSRAGRFSLIYRHIE
jgi:hypothetical protein